MERKAIIMNGKNYIVTYALNSDYESINILTLIAMKEFGEVGVYTKEESEKVYNFLSGRKVPKFIKTHSWGSKTYEEWEEWVKENNQLTKELLDGKQT